MMFDTTTTIADGVGGIDVGNSRAFVPARAASANNFAVAIWYETRD